jgi:pimeloyl-[acyl-carrier protein] methyl ester esterase
MHAGVWQGFTDQLAEHCMVVTLDLRGHGDSRDMEGPYTFEQNARDVIALLEHLGLRDAALLGWSMGVSVILTMFAQGFTGTGALMFVSGNPSLVQRCDYECALAPAIVRRLFKQVQRDYPHGLSIFLNLLCTAQEHAHFSVDPAYRAAMDISRCPEREAALSSLKCLQDEDLRPHLSRITAPCLIVHGESDEICLSNGGRFMNDSIPGSQLLMLPDTGHMPFISRRERVVEAVLEFLSM